ncbi:glycosyl hydrolase family 18 protein [Tenacibaculum sp. 190524A02b]|uniref:glycosyl hydrolase family 18 protein n=1 Tax=Tenacibaculum vairaonense TaxID=3137860 RepID=UPI0031FB88AA
MRKKLLTLSFLICSIFLHAQYQFPDCYGSWDSSKQNYVKGDQVSYEGINYEAKYYTTEKPGHESWQVLGPCGDGGLGEDYNGKQRIIGYLPTWIKDYDIKNDFKPEVVSNLNISFLTFKQNNTNYNSSDFASIAFDEKELKKVDSVLTECKVLSKAKAKNVKVSVAVGGAIDYAFLWLMTKYYNNDQKLEEIANLLVNYIKDRNLDGVDLDLECWWNDPAITGTVDQGGRKRGDQWGGSDEGPHPAAIGLTNLSKKLREKMPNKLISAAVFGTSWYGNNYDGKMADYMDWIGLMTYDFTGSWDKSPIGPHSSLYKVPAGSYTGQTADDPIYSVQDALEYWLGIAPPTWNHGGGLGVKKSKLVIGVPMYGYDFSERKPAGSNGYKFVPYRKMLEEFPDAATSYDAKDPKSLNGHVGLNGKNIYFDTPKQAGEKIKYSKNYGHQGVIVWELTQDASYDSPSSILKALNDASGNGTLSEDDWQFASVQSLKLYPTIVKDEVKLLINSSKENVIKVKIYDYLGNRIKTLMNDKAPVGTNVFNLQVPNLKPGVYLCGIEINGKRKVKKLVKK